MNRNLLSALSLLTLVSACSFDLSTSGLYTGVASGDVVPDRAPSTEAERDDSGSAIAATESTLPPGTVVENDWITTDVDPLATFSIDVDTASYTRVRGSLQRNALPLAADIRVEEFLNYFDYKYPTPDSDTEEPFGVFFEGVESPFGEGLHMLRLGLQGGYVGREVRPAANLVFLIDVSGSMADSDKLPLLQQSMHVLVDSLRPDDTVAIVTYAGMESTALPPTRASSPQLIHEAIDGLTSGGSTNGEGGIRMAYQLASTMAELSEVTRVILATDGDFNVGLTGEPLIELVEDFANRDITLTALLFGNASTDDAFLEELTNRGDGNYFHIDRIEEAHRVLSEDVVGTLLVIASDVKLQVQLNPDAVARYRVVGYDNRILADEDFANDFVDAGDMGAGHTVTGLLEVELRDDISAEVEIASVHVRYKPPGSNESILAVWPLYASDMVDSVDDASASTRLALAVAEFAEILRRSRHSEGERFQEILDLLAPLAESDADVGELIQLVQRARGLW